MVPRNLRPKVLASLADSPVVFLQGARQTGKSTLVQDLAESDRPAAYLTLDDAVVLAATQRDPQGFVAGLVGPVILDEVQRVPDLFLAIKAAVDRDREPGRFLLTGSANVRVVPMLADALVGRVEILTLWPFSQDEIEERDTEFVDRLFSSEPPRPIRLDTEPGDLTSRMLRGGFPEALRRKAPDRLRSWFGSYVTTILQRDVRDMANIDGLAELPRLLALFAARSGTLLNLSELSRSSGIPQTTLKRYMGLLEATFLLDRLPPWTTNLGKRLVKAPKILVCDTGLVASLLGFDEERVVADPSMHGHLLETFVAMELRKQSSWSRLQPSLHHYRSHGGAEVDIVLEEPGGKVVGVEVKASTSVVEKDLRGLRELAEISGDRFVRGVVLYRGDRVVPFGPRLHAFPLPVLWAGVP